MSSAQQAPARTSKSLRILHLEDDPADAALFKRTLARNGLQCEITQVISQGDFIAELANGHYDLIVSDYTIPGYSGLAALETACLRAPYSPFIFLSGTMQEEAALESLKLGASDYVLKDRPRRIVVAVQRALREAQEQTLLRYQAHRLREQAALLDLAREAIIVAEMGGIVRYWNRGAERLHGWKADEVLGQSTKDFLYKDLSWYNDAVTILHERDEWGGEVPKRTKAGGDLLMYTRWSLVRDQNGKPESVLSISTDVTEQREIRTQLLRVQRTETIGAMAGGIAHDLRNVFAPIMMASQLLGENPSESERQSLLNLLTGCAKRGSEMVSRILEFARGTGGLKQPLQIQPVFAELERLLANTLPRSITVKIKVEPELPAITANATQLNQVLMNLCVNARDAMPNGGVLTITVERSVSGSKRHPDSTPPPGNLLLISVADTGTGIPADLQTKIFQPFFTTKGPDKGTGLGLSTARAIIDDHAGVIDVYSQPDSGTTFLIYLPFAPQSSATSIPVKSQIV